MIAQELHPFPYQPEGAAPPAQTPPPRHLGRWGLAALVLGVLPAGAAIGAGGASALSRTASNAPAQAATAATVTLSAPSPMAQQNRPTLRFAAHADLKVLDPVWTTAYITRNHAYLVYDTLFGTDENLRVQPQMVDRTTVSHDGKKYTFTLREVPAASGYPRAWNSSKRASSGWFSS